MPKPVLVLDRRFEIIQLFTVFMASTSAANIMGVNLTYFPSVSLAQRAAKNIVGIINLPSEDDAARAIKKEGHNGDITFTNVSFKYPTRPDIPILKDVSFTIPVGKSVAFVGPSGCGKSTIISLIQRFYRPDTGSISLGGDLIESLNLDWYRGLLGAVNQEPVMFAGTIRSNLQLGVERILTDAELEEALCLDLATRCSIDWIPIWELWERRYREVRSSVWRFCNPSILLLDETTSALDSEK